MIYPTEISAIIKNSRHSGMRAANCVGTEANFSCGSVVRIRLDIDPWTRTIGNASFTSNGCGWMVASGEAVCAYLEGKKLADLRGFAVNEILGRLVRPACAAASVSAAKAALADFRSRQIEEFRGENALICTCFGVTEDRIEEAIRQYQLTSVEGIGDATKAGTGCGSCLMLIEEMIENAR